MAEIKAERGHLFYRRVIHIIIFTILATIVYYVADITTACYPVPNMQYVRLQTDWKMIEEKHRKKPGKIRDVALIEQTFCL